jgi:hypothetical protein
MIGIGVGNNDSEVTNFKKKFNFHFPLFSDPDFCIHKILQQPKTPFIFLALKETDRFKIVSVFDPKTPVHNQFQRLRKTVFLTTLIPLDKGFEVEGQYYIINRNCCLWNFPYGEPAVCFLKGNMVKEIGMDGNWRQIEIKSDNLQIQGWLPF